MSPSKLHENLDEHAGVIYRKCKQGTYKFAPYVELLKNKGAKKPPRVISYPIVRDRIVLYLLKEVLHEVFPESVPRKLPNNYVKEVADFIQSNQASGASFIKSDITNFYGSIPHDALFGKLKTRIRSKKILQLLERAICTPTVPANYRKAELQHTTQVCGIPQGLAISNVLANIYLHDFDHQMEGLATKYIRYVDDILFFVEPGVIESTRDSYFAALQELRLTINQDKTYDAPITSRLEFLGYRYKLPIVTVRPSSVERFLSTCASRITSHGYKAKQRARISGIDLSTLRRTFLDDLNEKITGAIHESKRYGWIFYYQELNDIALLFRMDSVIAELLTRLSEFGSNRPTRLKRLVRAHYEAKYSPRNGYIYDYSRLDNLDKRREYLRCRGKLDPEREYTPTQIEEMFARTRGQNLASLEADVGRLS